MNTTKPQIAWAAIRKSDGFVLHWTCAMLRRDAKEKFAEGFKRAFGNNQPFGDYRFAKVEIHEVSK